MRGKKELLDKIVFSDENAKVKNDFDKIKELLTNNNDFFLGVRSDYFNLYYKSMSLAKVTPKKRPIDQCSFQTSYFYLIDLVDGAGNKPYAEKTTGYFSPSSELFWKNLDSLKKRADEHVMGMPSRIVGREDHYKLYLEKACQQWIINVNNSNPDSEWYYVDMEYIYDRDEKEKNTTANTKVHYGRADMIAISRRPVDGKHKVAFVELKVGTDAYSGGIELPEDDDLKTDAEAALKTKDIFDERLENVKFGSGLTSHVVDFLHFFNDKDVERRKQLRQEILNILQFHKKFGLIPEESDLHKLENSDAIEINPDIYIVSYSSAPNVTKDMVYKKASKKYPNVDLQGMKTEFCKYLYDLNTKPVLFDEKNKAIKGSTQAAECLFAEEGIKGILSVKDEIIDSIKNNDGKIEFKCKQKIGRETFNFTFRFLNLADTSIDPKKCI